MIQCIELDRGAEREGLPPRARAAEMTEATADSAGVHRGRVDALHSTAVELPSTVTRSAQSGGSGVAPPRATVKFAAVSFHVFPKPAPAMDEKRPATALLSERRRSIKGHDVGSEIAGAVNDVDAP